MPAGILNIDLKVGQLHFDPMNPRRDPIEDEAEIRRTLCNDEAVKNLAAHIAAHGLNPLKRVAVVPHPQLPDHYVVHEGNRRLCALQLLRDPDRAPDPAARRYFQKLVDDGGQRPDTVPCARFESGAETLIWKSVEHEGEQAGVGTVPWNATQIARHNRLGERSRIRPGNQNQQALALLDYAESRHLIDAAERKLISLTTITRYLTTPLVRDSLALLNNADLETSATQEDFDTVVRKFLLDAMPSADPAEKPKVHSRSSSLERQNYAASLKQDGFAPQERPHEPYVPDAAGDKATPAPAAAKATRTRSTTALDKRKTLAPSSFKVITKDAVLSRLLREAKALSPSEASFSCVYLTRAVLERLIFLYTQKYKLKFPSRDLHVAIQNCLKHAEENFAPLPKNVSIVMRRASSDENVSYSPNSLGAILHGSVVPAAVDVKRNWDSWSYSFSWLQEQLAVSS